MLDPSTHEADAGGSLLSLRPANSEFQDILGYIEKLFLEEKEKTISKESWSL